MGFRPTLDDETDLIVSIRKGPYLELKATLSARSLSCDQQCVFVDIKFSGTDAPHALFGQRMRDVLPAC